MSTLSINIANDKNVPVQREQNLGQLQDILHPNPACFITPIPSLAAYATAFLEKMLFYEEKSHKNIHAQIDSYANRRLAACNQCVRAASAAIL